jgi:hypothetical protein
VKLVGRLQHQEKQHDQPLVAFDEAASDEVDDPHRDRRVRQGHQLK